MSRPLAKRYTAEDVERAFQRGQLYMRRRCWSEFRKSDFQYWPSFDIWATWLPVQPTRKKR